MAERSVVVRLRAEVADFKRQLAEATKAVEGVGNQAKQTSVTASTAMGRMVQSARVHRQEWDQAGRTLVGFGTITVAALAASATAAVNWESAWTGVLKTVDGTDEQLQGVEDGLRGLARTLPATHGEIAAVAEAAGQLGVKTKDIVDFTKVMIDLGETTNLSADEAATSIAQLMNVMRTAPRDVDRVGAALVALGNAGASTERDIIQMAQRMSSSAQIIGLTEGEVLGLANAMASVGIEVEAGGSAVSRVLTDIAKAVAQGGDDLQSWARVAGMTGADFARKWKADPAEALALFIDGLGRMQAAGEDVFTTLDDLGQSDVRTSRALLSMATSGDLLRESLELGNQAWEENNALAEEAAKRYDTTAAKVAIARNSLNDAAISIGDTFLPVVASAAGAVADFSQGLADLPVPAQQAIAGIGGVAGVAALAGGAFLLTFPRVMDTVRAFKELDKINGPLATGLGRVGKAAAGVFAAAMLLELADAAQTAEVNVEELQNRVIAFVEGTAGLGDVFADVGKGWADDLPVWSQTLDFGTVEDFQQALDKLSRTNAFSRLSLQMQDLLGQDGGVRALGANLGEIGVGLAQVANTDLSAAQDQFDQFVTAAGGGEEVTRQLLNLMPEYREALYGVANAQGMTLDEAGLLAAATGDLALVQDTATDSADELAVGMGGIAEPTDEATEALEAWRDMVTESLTSFVDIKGAYDDVIQANIDMAQATADGTDSAEDSWETYYDGITVSAAEWITNLEAQVAAQESWAANIEALSARVNETMTVGMRDTANAMIDELIELGPEGAAAVEAMKNMSDPELQRMVELYGRKGAAAAAEVTRQIESHRAPTITPVVLAPDISNAQGVIDRFIQRNDGRTIAINAAGGTVSVSSGVRGNDVARAYGGPVFGPGTETSDSIDARLSHNEHVWSAAEVKGAGGHAAVANLRAAARMGLPPTATMRFANGGSPAWSGAGVTQAAAGLTAGDLAAALSGLAFTLLTDAGPIRAIARVEAVRTLRTGARR